MTKIEYKEYLSSRYWKDKRLEVLIFYKNQCVVCDSCYSLNVHHMKYTRLGKEKMSDLVVLCKHCHQIIHFNFFNDHIKDIQRLRQRLKKMKNNYKKMGNFGMLSRIENGIPIAHPLIQLRWNNAARGKQ